MIHIRGIKGEAVVVYCEPLITKEMGYYRLSRRINKNEINNRIHISPMVEISKPSQIIQTVIEINIL